MTSTKRYSFRDDDRYERRKREEEQNDREIDSDLAYRMWYSEPRGEESRNERLKEERDARKQEQEAGWEERHADWERDEDYEPTPFGGAVDDTELVNDETMQLSPPTKIVEYNGDFYKNFDYVKRAYWKRLHNLNGDWITFDDYRGLLKAGEGGLMTMNVARNKWRYQLKYDYTKDLCRWLEMSQQQEEHALAIHMDVNSQVSMKLGCSWEVTAFCAAIFVLEMDDSRFYSPGKTPLDANGEKQEPDPVFCEIEDVIIENEKRKKEDRDYNVDQLRKAYKQFQLHFQRDGAMTLTDGGQIIPDGGYFDGKFTEGIHGSPLESHEYDGASAEWESQAHADETEEYIF